MRFKGLDGCYYNLNTTVDISYLHFEFDNIDKAVDFLCSSVQSYDDNPEKINLEMIVEKYEEGDE